MKKGLRITLITLGCLVGILLLLSFLAGPIVKWYAEKHSVELCHREATIGQVWINVFTGSFLIKDLQVQEENAEEEFLSFDKLRVRISLPKILKHKVQINRIELAGLNAVIVQNGIRFNFSDIIDLYANKPPKEDEKSSKPWAVDIRKISVRNSRVVYNDAHLDSHFDTKNINIDVPRLFLSGNATHADMTMDFEKMGKLGLSGDYDIQKGEFGGNLKLTDFQIKDLKPYLSNFLNIGEVSGIANGVLKAKGNVQHILNLTASGNLSLKNVKLTNEDQSPLLSCSSFKVDVDKVDLGSNEYRVHDILVDGMEAYFNIYQDGNSLTSVLKRSEKDTSSTVKDSLDIQKGKDKSSKPIRYSVNVLQLNDCSIVYSDQSITPQPQTFIVSNFNLSAKDLQNGSLSPIELSAHLGKMGTLECHGRLDLMNLSNAHIDLSIKDLDMTEFTPYALYYLAYPITDGLLSFESNTSISNNMLNSRNGLDIYRPTFGDRNKSIKPAAAKIPMKLAMYVITDRKGHAKMDIPVRGDISSPSFSFRKVIWKTFLNLMVKIAASPVDFIAKEMTGNGTFSPMSLPMSQPMELSTENIHQLNQLSDVMQEKDKMHLMVTLSSPMAVDSEGMEPAEDGKWKCMEQCERMIGDYLQNKGVPIERIHFKESERANGAQECVKATFNLSMPDEKIENE